MNERDLDRMLSAWVDDPSTPPAPRYLGDVLERTRRTRQRAAWTSLERWIPMTTTLRAPTMPLPARLLALGLTLVLALLAVAAVGTLIGSLTRQPATVIAPSASNGLVVYSRDGDIYVVDPFAGEPRLLVGGPEQDVGPYWSPDGSRLLFVRVPPDGGETFTFMVTDAEGSLPVAIHADPLGDVNWVTWAPDSSAIAVGIASDDSSTEGPWISILEVPGDGSGAPRRRLMQTGPSQYPTWRPQDPLHPLEERQQVLYRRESDPGAFGLGLVVPAGQEGAVGLADDSQPTLMTVDQMEGQRTIGYGGDHDFHGADWSPDGSRFAYHTLNDIGTNAPDGNGMRVHVASLQPCDEGECPTDALLEFDPASNDETYVVWSSDGTRLAFQAYEAGASRLAIMTISSDPKASVIDVVATAPITVSDCCGALGYAWAPDGSALVLSNTSSPTSNAWLVDATTAEMTKLDWPMDDWPTWQRR